jgi:hypothetical protein
MSVSKSRPSYRPNVETLESRMQPGSILTGGLGVSLLGSALDLSSLLNESGTNQSHTLNHPRAINNQTDTSSDSSQVIIAPSHGSVETSQSATPVATNSTASSNLANQVVAINAASQHAISVSSTSGHSVPLGNTNGTGNTAKNSPLSFGSDPIRAGATVATRQMAAVANVHPATNFVGRGWTNSDGGIQPFDMLNWVSYFGNAGSKLNKVAVAPDGGVLLAGTVQDNVDPTINDAIVAKLTSDGSTLVGMSIVGLPVSGTQSSANGLAVDNAGNIYASGTATPPGGGPGLAVAAKVDFASPTGYDWLTVVGFSAQGGAGDVANGCQLDAAGANLYVAGTGDASPVGGGPGALEIAALSTVDGSGNTYGFNYVDGNGNPETAVGNDVAATSTGGVDVAVQLQTAAGGLASFGVAPSAAAGPASFATFTTDNGYPQYAHAPNADGAYASMSSILVDASNNIYFTGQGFFNAPNEGIITRQIIGFARPDGSGVHGYGWYVYNTGTGVQGNWVSNGLALNGDHTPATSGTLDDNSGGFGTHGTILAHFAGDGGTIIDSTNFGNPTPFGANDDYGTGVAIGNTLFGAIYYQDGWTNSTDFNVTAGVYQPTYGGDPSTGWVGQINLS